MTTKEIFDLYYKDKPAEIIKKVRPQVDRPEVYAYEAQIGKQIFDMDVDELFGLVTSFNSKRTFGANHFSISYGSYYQIASVYRDIWNFYIDKVTLIKNPWTNKEMRGTAAAARLAELKGAFTYEMIDSVIKNLYHEYPSESYAPPYIECLLLLFYNGFSDAQEIVELKESMINFRTHDVILRGRTKHLSDRCFELLQYVHNLDEIDTERGLFKAVPYRDGYFKFIIRPKNIKSFQNKTLTDVGAVITRKISTEVRNRFNFNHNGHEIFLLGFYDYIVSKAGKERAKELVLSVRNSDDAQELMQYVREYGVVAENVTYVKKQLRPFI